VRSKQRSPAIFQRATSVNSGERGCMILPLVYRVKFKGRLVSSLLSRLVGHVRHHGGAQRRGLRQTRIIYYDSLHRCFPLRLTGYYALVLGKAPLLGRQLAEL